MNTCMNTWLMQSSDRVGAHGETLSSADYTPADWLPATVPGTVVAGLVENGVYPDPYIGLNMQTLPGYKRGVTTHFSRHFMPDDSPFRRPWWYRTTFDIPQDYKGKRLWLLFKGINYSANILLNGKRIAGSNHVAGTFRGYDLEVTHHIRPAGPNVLALELFAPQPDDLCLTFIDWNPVPPDDCMGIWQPVVLSATGPVAIRHPFVSCEFAPSRWDRATLTPEATLVNAADRPLSCNLTARIGPLSVRRTVRLPAHGRRTVRFTPHGFPELLLHQPRLWWPYQLGEPYLYRMEMRVDIKGVLSDSATVDFGIREVRSRFNQHGARIFSVNGHDLLIRGAAWVPDLMLRQSRNREVVDIAMLKTMQLNALRFEGKLGSDELWDRCDREGILVLAGWPCCNHWERWHEWKPGDREIAEASLRWQMLRLRHHPALLAWLYGSDFPPPEPVERLYLKVIKEIHPGLTTLSSAAAFPSALRGPTGVKMTGPNKYVPPAYWYDTTKPGYADSFNLETCPDACIPVYESLKRFIPGDQCRPGSPAWNHHAGVSAFSNTDDVNQAVAARYGSPDDMRDFSRMAQVLGYEAWRAMFEAYARNYPRATGVIGWMLNSAWPSVNWQLYDVYLQPNGAFYGTQKACEPLHLQYSYDDASFWATNLALEPRKRLTANIAVVDLNGNTRFEEDIGISLGAYERRCLRFLPKLDASDPVSFLFLRLRQNKRPVARNVYWLAASADVFEPETKQKFSWPLQKHADFSALRTLPPAKVCSRLIFPDDDNRKIKVALQNTSAHPAFFLWLKLVDRQTGALAAPVYWSENALTLRPGEPWEVQARLADRIDRDTVQLLVEGT